MSARGLVAAACAVAWASCHPAFAQQPQPPVWYNNGTFVCGAIKVNLAGGGATCTGGQITIPAGAGGVATATSPLSVSSSNISLGGLSGFGTAGEPIQVNALGTGLAYGVLTTTGGGTGAASHTPTNGQLLVGQTATANYNVKTMSGDGTMAATGALTVTGIGGAAISGSASTDNTYLRFNGTQWVPVLASSATALASASQAGFMSTTFVEAVTKVANSMDASFGGNAVTSDNTETTCGTYTVLTDVAAGVRCQITGIESDESEGAYYERSLGARNAAGTVTQIGATAAIVTVEDNATWNVTLDVSGTTVRVRVTGASDAGKTISWRSRCQVTYGP